MATDDHKIERHLTPHGWVTGNEWINGKQIKAVDPPADRIETWIEEISDSSEGWAPSTTFSELAWESSGVSAQSRTDLKQKYPRPEYKPWKPIPKRKRRIKSFS
jgi:hypothetical protein